MDVIVAGGGMAGVAAAVSAAKKGASVVIVEKYGFLGGMATAGWVGPFLGHTVPGTEEASVRGFLEELTGRLCKKGGSVSFNESLKKGMIHFNAEILKLVLDEIVKDYGIDIRFHTVCIGAKVVDKCISSIELYSKNGRYCLSGKVFIDSTGDGDLIFQSGAGYSLGRPEDGKVQAMGGMFRISNVASGWEADREKIRLAIDEARQKEGLSVYNNYFFGWTTSNYATPDFAPNMTRCGGNPVDTRDITEAEINLRKTAWKVLEICKDVSDFFKDAHILFAPHAGIRESRRMEGIYELTQEDILGGKKYPDSVARSSYWIDIHCPLGRTANNVHLCKKDCPTGEPCVMLEKFPGNLPSEAALSCEKDYSSIPFRCLSSKDIKNLLASGRCISVSHQALAAVRVMAPCMAFGQAAGAAAALSVIQQKVSADLDVVDIQKALVEQNALF